MYFLATTIKGSESGVLPGDSEAQWSSNITQSIYIHFNQTSPHNLDAMLNNIARSMTLALRTQLGSTQQVTGQSLTPRIIVRVEWAWISLPFIAFALVLVFLTVVAVSTRRAGLEPWKGSNIATLFHGLRHRSDDKLHCLIDQNSMDEAAAIMQFSLRMDEGSQFLELE